MRKKTVFYNKLLNIVDFSSLSAAPETNAPLKLTTDITRTHVKKKISNSALMTGIDSFQQDETIMQYWRAADVPKYFTLKMNFSLSFCCFL